MSWQVIHVSNNRITKALASTDTIGYEQAGFREGFSTTGHTFVLHVIVSIYLAKKKRLYCGFIDYKKAFDFVDRASLWRKLLDTGVDGKIFRIIRNLYNNEHISDYFPCNVGVRQGEILSPLLFAIYLNDFQEFVSRHYNRLNSLTVDTLDTLEIYLKLYMLCR